MILPCFVKKKAGDLELQCQISSTLNLRGRGNKRSELYELVFVNQYLRQIMNIRWTDSVWKDTVGQTRHYGKDGSRANHKTDHEWKVGENWPHRLLMKTTTKITRQTLKWSPQGKRKRGQHGWVDLTSGEGWTWLEEEYMCNWTSMDI